VKPPKVYSGRINRVGQNKHVVTERQGVGGSIPSLAIKESNKLRAADWLPASALCAYDVPTLTKGIFKAIGK
jgi:hypothetical protein